ncbi:hypothetical protein COLU111180_16370 [Cohnella lubricantis]|uniref:Uncharacterized protein n=1 Tax=Cohnella lubricantis TaxID=2163172 RepID=A0A841TCT3_9BACL|nr:hypothetical protein [Cohnella lubricantis]MBB6677050.1 hypothetical protein [Cohnella lubricantis]MBP2119280.1 putative membrane protein [Cohnella lubricantis]
MKGYLSLIRSLLVYAVIVLALSATQVNLNMVHKRFLLMILFAIIFIPSLLFVVLLAIDLIAQDTRMMRVRVIQAEDGVLRVTKPNGKTRRVRILRNDAQAYRVGRELELTLTRRTGQVLAVKPVDAG